MYMHERWGRGYREVDPVVKILCRVSIFSNNFHHDTYTKIVKMRIQQQNCQMTLLRRAIFKELSFFKGSTCGTGLKYCSEAFSLKFLLRRVTSNVCWLQTKSKVFYFFV